MQRRHAAICAALVIITAIPALAQEPGLELQIGGGFLLADSDLSSLPSVEAGVVLWWSDSWGFSMRRGMTIGEHMASYNYGDGTRTGSRNLRHWTPTLRYRRALDSALELNLGVGLTFGSYGHLIWRPGAPRNPRADHFSLGGLATEALVGKRITPRLGIRPGSSSIPSSTNARRSRPSASRSCRSKPDRDVSGVPGAIPTRIIRALTDTIGARSCRRPSASSLGWMSTRGR